ncbi:traB domain-containing protein-like isoform X1 [Pistacia vera]|uniref:traB domain-containing protein-like isoform X1 n=1 Tax=Pistacia vera TaxID=55513 RepID=UPI001263BBE8|nr:traB domain-containing protein-like isoform X1 [Pistacia vera]
MNRLARLGTPINSSELRRYYFFTTAKTRIRLRRSITTLPLSVHRQFSPSLILKFTSFATVNNPNFPSMEPNPPESVEDFIHIENPNPDNVEALSESVVSLGESVVSYGDEVRDSGDAVSEETKKELPEELSKSVVFLTCESSAEGGTCDVYVVGTAHISQDSCREVEAIIDYLKPQAVFLELCSSRVAILTPQNLKVPTMGEMIEMYKKKHNMFGILYSWFLAKVASKLEVFPGSEFRVAFEEAMKYGGKVILGDRPVQITLRRTWAKMPLWHKAKLLYSLIFQAFFLPSPEDLNKMLKDMDDIDMLTLVIQEMSKEFPTLMETLVHERDKYMSSTLLRVASEHNSVVAVVGRGHLQGIKKHWKQPVSTNDLMAIPTQKPALSATKILTTLGVAGAGAAIISGIYLKFKK